MKRLLVPIDFSETSLNAAQYAMQMTKDVEGAFILLYNVYDGKMRGSDGSPLSTDPKTFHSLAQTALENARKDLKKYGYTEVRLLAETGDLIDNIKELVRREFIDMVVMGITGSSMLEQIFIGSNSLKVIEAAGCPVMIIPPESRFKGLNRIVYSSDFKDVRTSTPALEIRRFIDTYKSELTIANVEEEFHVEFSPEFDNQRQNMKDLFLSYNPILKFLHNKDFVEGIDEFVTSEEMDLIIIAPRKHNLFESLLQQSHTKKLAYHSHVPILAIQARES